MFASPSTSSTNRSPRAHPLSSKQCHPEHPEGSAFRLSTPRALSVPAFSSVASPFNLELSTFNALFYECSHQYHSTALRFPLFSYSYALFCFMQSSNSFLLNSFRTLCPKHPGWGTSTDFLCVNSAYSASLRYLFLSSTAASSKLSAVSSPLTTPNSFRIRTSAKCTCNPFRIRTSKTQHLKPFRMNTYKGGPAVLRSLPITHSLETPTPHGASLYTYKKGPAAREPRYSPCAAS